MYIKPASMGDLETILHLYEHARSFMAEHDNAGQWGDTYPPEELIRADITSHSCYLCMEENVAAAVFYYHFGDDPDYAALRNGAWLNEDPYGVVHRITSAGIVKGAASFCLKWAFQQCGNLKIDTHADNYVMQNLLTKNGFQRCGFLTVSDKDEWIAYQKVTL